MMEALAGWLKQIILVVLLATFIDLLLPNRTMQRYVKLVVSLFILMTILSPVLQLLGSNANVRMLAASVEGWSIDGSTRPPSGSGGGPAAGTSIPALGEVLAEGEALEQRRNAQSLELLAARLESMVADHVREQHGYDASAKAALELDRDGMPVLRSIRIRLGAALPEAGGAENAGAEAEDGRIAEVRIEPVEIEPVRIEPIAPSEPAQPAASPRSATAAESAPGAATDKTRREIAASVAKAWGLPAAKVIVEAVEASGARDDNEAASPRRG
ncbi:stage III sporulation protein AF [Paenibacillus sp.]|uniref:stage III sporulation protein AF n=1 Tax=Paenibacillus sp. TaxID=58172 RepID=UPI002D72483B|nr:stage III sporulation protein AF [Paenibacillus sp.]HZG85119.1 stage III sporulation protein AF [Paenibacillus sp.]